MKLKDGFVLRTVAGETVVLPSGDATNFDMMITLNETGRFLWEHMESEIIPRLLTSASRRMLVISPEKGKRTEDKVHFNF